MSIAAVVWCPNEVTMMVMELPRSGGDSVHLERGEKKLEGSKTDWGGGGERTVTDGYVRVKERLVGLGKRRTCQ